MKIWIKINQARLEKKNSKLSFNHKLELNLLIET